jgi:hypothetical protein
MKFFQVRQVVSPMEFHQQPFLFLLKWGTLDVLMQDLFYVGQVPNLVG